MTTPTTDSDTYFTEIEAHFAHRRGTPFLFSSKDWALMKSWHDEGVPLAIVLEAIDACFDSREKAGRKRTISSLSYCKHAVADIWAERRDQAVGGSGSVPEADPRGALDAVINALREASDAADPRYRESFATTLDDLQELAAASMSVPETEDRLVAAEQRLMAALLEAMPDAERHALIASVDLELARYTIDDDETLRKTRAANLWRLVRRRVSLPRLSLFG
ncbi:MAG: hypothetical protein HYU52_02295 [Acidobacteria bacterium]|nr:hypothetical protein [Acidobacteriota bacterium]